VRRHFPDHVDLAALQRQGASRGVLVEAERHLIEVGRCCRYHRRCPVVVGIRFERQVVIRDVLDEAVRPRPDLMELVLRRSPLGQRRGEAIPQVHLRKGIQQRGEGLAQPEDDCRIVDHLDRLERAEHRCGLLGQVLRIAHALQIRTHGFRIEPCPVMKAHVLPQVEGVRASVGEISQLEAKPGTNCPVSGSWNTSVS